jgi:glycine/D-amino acid oxidase-like deaminating enzyme
MCAVTRVRTRYGTSPWDAALPAGKRSEYPTLRGDHQAQVVIIGGGLTGCAIAHACAAAGVRPLLLERARLAQGSSGRSGGLVLPEPGVPFKDLVAAHGLRSARQVYELWRQGALDASALLKRLGLGRTVSARELVTLATGADAKALEREFEARTAAGLTPAWLAAKQLRALVPLAASGGMRMRGGFMIDPVRVTLGLAGAATKKGAAIFERTAVQKVRFDRTGVEAITAAGRVRAGTVIIATGAATVEFRALRRHFKRRETYCVLTEPMPAAMRRTLGAPGLVLAAAPPSRRVMTVTPDNRLLVTGGDQAELPARARPAALVQRTGQLMYESLMMFPSISGLQPEYGWEAGYGQTADGLMYVGPHRNYPHHLFALGGSGQSLTGAFVAARLIARALSGESRKGDEVLGWTR